MNLFGEHSVFTYEIKEGRNAAIKNIPKAKRDNISSSYETHSLYIAIRETVAGATGRSHIFLAFLKNREAFQGYFLNPYSGNQKLEFHGINAFLKEANAFVKRIAEKDVHGDMVNCCSRWIEDRMPDRADFAVYLTVINDKEWEGKFFIPDKGEEQEFYRKEELEALLREYTRRFRK